MPDPPHILLLEDSVNAARALSMLLERSGLHVTITGTLADALRSVHEHVFDLAIVDLRLPDGNGMDLVPALRRDGMPRPAIALTACEDKAASLAAGFDVHLTKPVQFRDLLSVVKQCLNPDGG